MKLCDSYCNHMHYKKKIKMLEEDKSSLFVEMTCFKIGKAGCPNLWCHSEVVLTLEKANRGKVIRWFRERKEEKSIWENCSYSFPLSHSTCASK